MSLPLTFTICFPRDPPRVHPLTVIVSIIYLHCIQTRIIRDRSHSKVSLDLQLP